MRLFVLITSVLTASVIARHTSYHRQPRAVHTREVVIKTVTVTHSHNNKAFPTLPELPSNTKPKATTQAHSMFQTQHPPSSSPSLSNLHHTPSLYSQLLIQRMQSTHPSTHHTPGPQQAYLSHGPNYRASILYHHNALRAAHQAPPLSWSASCESNARLAAQRCDFSHYLPPNAGQGQNLFTVSGTAFNVTAGITELWYRSELAPMMPWFGHEDLPDRVFVQVGHLTQVVWRGTRKVGCVSVDCGKRMKVDGKRSAMNKYTVCNYAPAGNVGGGFAENVVAPVRGAERVHWTD